FALGVAVFSGMLGVTAFGIFFTPVFYELIRGRTDRRAAERPAAPAPVAHAPPPPPPRPRASRGSARAIGAAARCCAERPHRRAPSPARYICPLTPSTTARPRAGSLTGITSPYPSVAIVTKLK